MDRNHEILTPTCFSLQTPCQFTKLNKKNLTVSQILSIPLHLKNAGKLSLLASKP